MKRTGKILAALFVVGAAYGCGSGSETGMQTPPLGQGGMTGLVGQGATGSTWAPVVGGQGSAGFGNAGTSGVGVTGGVGGPAGTGGVGGPVAGTGAGIGGMGPTGGMGPVGGMGPAGGTGGGPATSSDPIIPEVTGECPNFDGGSISFMNLSGITIDSGPKPAGPTAPMVFYWHGTLSSAGEYAGMAAAVASGVRAEGGVLVAFNGTTGGDGLSGTSIFGRGDLDLVDQMVACAVRDRNVDPHRIFATGCSAGGLFSTAMAVLRSEYVAAAAPNSGGLTFPQMFSSAYTPPLMTIHGAPGADVVVIDFSDSSATADTAFKSHGGYVINCNHGGGHCGGGSLAPDIWEFFKAHPYGVDPQPSPWVSSGLPAGFNSSCEVF